MVVSVLQLDAWCLLDSRRDMKGGPEKAILSNGDQPEWAYQKECHRELSESSGFGGIICAGMSSSIHFARFQSSVQDFRSGLSYRHLITRQRYILDCQWCRALSDHVQSCECNKMSGPTFSSVCRMIQHWNNWRSSLQLVMLWVGCNIHALTKKCGCAVTIGNRGVWKQYHLPLSITVTLWFYWQYLWDIAH